MSEGWRSLLVSSGGQKKKSASKAASAITSNIHFNGTPVPVEILTSVLKYMSLAKVAQCEIVCKTWKSYVWRSVSSTAFIFNIPYKPLHPLPLPCTDQWTKDRLRWLSSIEDSRFSHLAAQNSYLLTSLTLNVPIRNIPGELQLPSLKKLSITFSVGSQSIISLLRGTKRTVEDLSVPNVYDHDLENLRLLKHISEFCPNLSRLVIQSEDWSSLHQCANLKHMFIRTSNAVLDTFIPPTKDYFVSKLVALHTSTNPPLVGVNLSFEVGNKWTTLACVLATHNDYDGLCRLVSVGLDFTRAVNPSARASQGSRILFKSGGLSLSYDEAFSLGINPIARHNGKTIFFRLLTKKKKKDEDGNDVDDDEDAAVLSVNMEGIFKEPWRKAVSQESIPSLLTPTGGTIDTFFLSLDASRLHHVSNHDLCALDSHQRNAVQLCTQRQALRVALSHDIPWTMRNNFGQTALDYHAAHFRRTLVSELLLHMTQEEFAEYVRPWHVGMADPELSKEVLAKFRKCVPERSWRPYVQAYTHLNACVSGNLDFLTPRANKSHQTDSFEDLSSETLFDFDLDLSEWDVVADSPVLPKNLIEAALAKDALLNQLLAQAENTVGLNKPELVGPWLREVQRTQALKNYKLSTDVAVRLSANLKYYKLV